MDARNLDRLARLVATSFSRRQTLKMLGAAAGLAALPLRVGVAAPHRAAQDDDEAPLLRDFAATTLALMRSPALADYSVTGDLTLLTKEAAARARLYDEGVVSRLFGDHGLLLARRDTLAPGDGSGWFYLTQLQFPDASGAAAGYDELRRALSYPAAEDVTVDIPGQTQSVAYHFGFQTEEGEEFDRVNTVVQVDELVVTGTYDTIGQGTAPTDGWGFAELLEAYDDRAWGGAAGQAAQTVTPWMPLVEGVEEFRYYLGIVDGEVVPRYRGGDAAEFAALNPGVEHALFGSYGLTGGSMPIQTYFGVRSFADQGAADEYWVRLPQLMQRNTSGVTWSFAGGTTAIEAPNLAHAGTWNPAENVQLVGAHVAIQIAARGLDGPASVSLSSGVVTGYGRGAASSAKGGAGGRGVSPYRTQAGRPPELSRLRSYQSEELSDDGDLVIDVGAFVPLNGDPPPNPSDSPQYGPLVEGIWQLMLALLEAEAGGETMVDLGYLGDYQVQVPEQWR